MVGCPFIEFVRESEGGLVFVVGCVERVRVNGVDRVVGRHAGVGVNAAEQGRRDVNSAVVYGERGGIGEPLSEEGREGSCIVGYGADKLIVVSGVEENVLGGMGGVSVRVDGGEERG